MKAERMNREKKIQTAKRQRPEIDQNEQNDVGNDDADDLHGFPRQNDQNDVGMTMTTTYMGFPARISKMM